MCAISEQREDISRASALSEEMKRAGVLVPRTPQSECASMLTLVEMPGEANELEGSLAWRPGKYLEVSGQDNLPKSGVRVQPGVCDGAPERGR